MATDARLIRSCNFLDLNAQSLDQEREYQLHHVHNDSTDTSSQLLSQEDSEQGIQRPRARNHVDTQTSITSLRDVAEEEPENGRGNHFFDDNENGQVEENGEQQEPRAPDAVNEADLENRLLILTNLLAIERQENEKRRTNNNGLQRYIERLQLDYLGLQRDLVEALELGHKIKAQKEAQLAALDGTLKEKNRLIEQLKFSLESLDENKLRAEFKELLDKQIKLAELARQQLKDQLETVEQQLFRERANSSQLLQQFQTKLDDQLERHGNETNELRNKITFMEKELGRVLEEPKNLVIKALREETSRLNCQVDEVSLMLEESQSRYKMLDSRIENLLAEFGQVERRNHDELVRLRAQVGEQRKISNQLKMNLDEREESMQVLQFNLERSERRAQNLLAILGDKEGTFKEMIAELQMKREQELEEARVQVHTLERQVTELSAELDKKQNELVRLELEHENQLESIRNDRDQRINKWTIEKQRLERDFQSAELKLAREQEEKQGKCKLAEQYLKEAQQFKEESMRLSIELTQCEAKLFSKQKELDEALAAAGSRSQAPKREHEVNLELEEFRRHSKRLEETISELRADNEKAHNKLRVNESHLSRISAAVKQEHAKLVHEYEARLKQMKLEQSANDRNKMKYKKYGHKLKKYCEHLRRVHEHLCSPSVCGYVIT